MGIMNKVKYKLFLREWKSKNPNSNTIPQRIIPFDKVKVGRHSYGTFDVYLFNETNTLKIGNYVSIGPDVIFDVSAEHPIETFSTYPFKAHIMNIGNEGISKGNIIIDDDVWIGSRAIILSGVHVYQGAVIGAGAVVTKDVPPYAIVCGVPARVIKYRFSKELIDELIKIDYSKIDDKLIIDNQDRLYDEIREKEQLHWLPKKKTVDSFDS